MIARYLPIALASLLLSTSITLSALAHRSSGRVEPEPSDRPALTKEQGTNPDMSGREGVGDTSSTGSRFKPSGPTLTKNADSVGGCR